MRKWKAVIGFVLLAAALDALLGFGLARLYGRVKTGDNGGLLNYTLSRHAQVLLLGSSRMRHHAMPSVLSQQLSLKTLNAGMDGQDFLYAVMLLDLWKRSHPPPQIIVLHVDPESLARYDEELHVATVFSFYYDRSALVRQILNQRSPFERLKYLSRSYRANGKVLSILKNLCVQPDNHFDGFQALKGTFVPGQGAAQPSGPADPASALPCWDFKVRLFAELVAYCRQNGTRLFLVHSPRYHELKAVHDAWVRSLQRFLAAYPGVQFIDLSAWACPGAFEGKADLFRDGSHLNSRGARVFSELLAARLRASTRHSHVAALDNIHAPEPPMNSTPRRSSRSALTGSKAGRQ